MKAEFCDVVIIGGGAGGFFTAIQIAERNPNLKITILEQAKEVLQKVRISGGGRCNVTHGCFNPKEMVQHYPRGHKELLGPFHRFMCGDMMEWLDSNGIPVNIEEDGRAFPASNDSATIHNLFNKLTSKYNIAVLKQTKVLQWEQRDKGWDVETTLGAFKSNFLVVAAGSSQFTWNQLEKLGHSIVSPVPSLFTFKTKHALIEGLMGLSFENAEVSIPAIKRAESGPLLITHWGLSGPAILKLSAWGARPLHDRNYHLDFFVNWIGESGEPALEKLKVQRNNDGKRLMTKIVPFDLPRRFWQQLISCCGIHHASNWGDVSNSELNDLAALLTNTPMKMQGKTTFKEEFVTCGGVDTDEVDFRTMESKILPKLFLIGEVLNIDGVTGGFNFQAVWTESVIAADTIASVNGI